MNTQLIFISGQGITAYNMVLGGRVKLANRRKG
jgi:hypothetical protein